MALAGCLAALGLVALDRAMPPDLSRLRAVGTEVLDREGRTLAVLPAPGGIWRLATRRPMSRRIFSTCWSPPRTAVSAGIPASTR